MLRLHRATITIVSYVREAIAVLAREFCRGQPQPNHNLFHRLRPEERRPQQPIQVAVPLSKTPWPSRHCRPLHHPTPNVALLIVSSGPEREKFFFDQCLV